MRLEHEFEVEAPVETVWSLLLDLERVAPCLPGGEVSEKIDERNYKAAVRVKLGPMNMTYRGQIGITEADEAARRTVMEGKANETRGQGTARATITTTLTAEGRTTKAHVATDLQLTGRAAQMGRGIVADVSNRLIGDFARCLSEQVTPPAAASDGADRAPARPRPAPSAPISGIALIAGLIRSRLARLRGLRRR